MTIIQRLPEQGLYDSLILTEPVDLKITEDLHDIDHDGKIEL